MEAAIAVDVKVAVAIPEVEVAAVSIDDLLLPFQLCLLMVPAGYGGGQHYSGGGQSYGGGGRSGGYDQQQGDGGQGGW